MLRIKETCLNYFCVHTPPSNSRCSSVEVFEELDHFLLDYSNDDYYYIPWCDFNVHTSTITDTVQLSPYVLEDDNDYEETD